MQLVTQLIGPLRVFLLHCASGPVLSLGIRSRFGSSLFLVTNHVKCRAGGGGHLQQTTEALGRRPCQPNGSGSSHESCLLFGGLVMKRACSSAVCDDLAAIARVPQHALDKITAALSKHCGRDIHVRQCQISRNIERAAGRVHHILSLPAKDSSQKLQWYVFHPAKMLLYFCSECSSFNMLMDMVVRSSPGGPLVELQIVVHLDEVTPGDPLRPANQKNSMCGTSR